MFVVNSKIEKTPYKTPIYSRESLSTPTIRAMAKIAEAWKLSDEEAMCLLGEDDLGLYFSWTRDPEFALLSEKQIKRVSYLLSVYRKLPEYLRRTESPAAWLRTKNESIMFRGKAPLEYMLEGDMDRIHSVLFYIT